MNRYWQMYFGTGIVKTAEDFGSQGEPPSHPELLDWLATEFIRSKWDVRAMQRLIVTSAAYRQSSRVTPELLEKDPENRLLARGPRFRLPAEMVRDNALAVSGLLNPPVGGPSVFPYQPKGLWEEMAFGDGFSAQTYVQSHGQDLYRRSMYTFWKRTVPPAQMSVFDAPDREKCTARRTVTNTPLQALVLLNDPTYVEAARVAGRARDPERPDEILRSAPRWPSSWPRRASPTSRNWRCSPSSPSSELRSRSRTIASTPTSCLRNGETPPDPKIDKVGTGRLDHGGQHDSQPRRDHHQGVTATMNYDDRLACTRRQFFGRASTGIGIAALASLFERNGLAAAGLQGLPALRAQSQARHLSAPVRRAFAARSVRLQAELRKQQGIDLPASVRMGQRITGMTSGQSTLPVAPSHLRLQATRSVGRLGQRTAAAHREDRRRHHHRQDHEHRRHQSRSGDHVHPDRQPAARHARAWAPGSATAWAARTRTCRRSSS